MSNLNTIVEGRVLEELVMLYAIMLLPGYFREDMTSFRFRPDVNMMLDSPWFIDSVKAGSGALYDTGVYDIDKMLYLLGDPQPATVLLPFVALICPQEKK